MLQEAITTYLNKTMCERVRKALQGLLFEIMYLDKIRCDIKKEVKQLRKVGNRGKRAVLGFVCDALYWLFGTVSESYLQGINSYMRTLEENQPSIVHVVEM